MANLKALPAMDLEIESRILSTPPLEAMQSALKKGLSLNFEDVEVSVVECPDLTQEPYNLASKGLCGNSRVLDIGGVPYLVPLAQKNKLYDMKDFPKLTGMSSKDDCLIIGAGAAPWTYLERNAEMMPNLVVKSDGSVVQKTHIARTHDKDQSYELVALPESETKMSLLGNLFLSNGEGGQVIKVTCKKRSGSDNFVSCMRKCLEKEFSTESLGLGGVFCAQKGQLKIHVMPEFSTKPLESESDVENWLNFYTMDSNFTCFSVFVSRDPGLDLRVEHTHGLNKEKCQGGHYHYDITPEVIEYTGYFNLAEYCYRVDRPKVTHMIGRD